MNYTTLTETAKETIEYIGSHQEYAKLRRLHPQTLYFMCVNANYPTGDLENQCPNLVDDYLKHPVRYVAFKNNVSVPTLRHWLWLLRAPSKQNMRLGANK